MAGTQGLADDRQACLEPKPYISSRFVPSMFPVLGEFRWFGGCGLKVFVQCFVFFIILNALPVPLLRQVFIDSHGSRGIDA